MLASVIKMKLRCILKDNIGLVGVKRTCLCVNARRQESRFIGGGYEVRRQKSFDAIRLGSGEAVIHVYCLMDKHYHLLLETPSEKNLLWQERQKAEKKD